LKSQLGTGGRWEEREKVERCWLEVGLGGKGGKFRSPYQKTVLSDAHVSELLSALTRATSVKRGSPGGETVQNMIENGLPEEDAEPTPDMILGGVLGWQGALK
jgi:hypothetical protein